VIDDGNQARKVVHQACHFHLEKYSLVRCRSSVSFFSVLPKLDPSTS
jgi:hypothetical protein